MGKRKDLLAELGLLDMLTVVSGAVQWGSPPGQQFRVGDAENKYQREL